MELNPYLDNLRAEFLDAAGASGAESAALAERLIGALDPAVRLTLLSALSQAADEITRDLAPGSVEVRLRGIDPSFIVTPPPAPGGYEAAGQAVPAEPEPEEGTEHGAPARINFRPSEQLKGRIEEAAARDGISVNAWLVRATTAAVQAGPRGRTERPSGNSGASGQHYNGWVR